MAFATWIDSTLGPGIARHFMTPYNEKLWTVPLDATGGSGTPVIINTEHTADGTVDVASDASGGAAVYGTLVGGIRPELRIRGIDEMGMPIGSERILSIGVETGRDASIAALFGGYAVAYRALDTNMLRVVFLTLTFDEVARLDLVDVTPDGGRTTIRASGDGALLVGWADHTASTEFQIRAARIRCN